MFAAKLLVNWLVGDNTLGEKAALPVIRMFISIILNNGDLLEKEHIRCFPVNSWYIYRTLQII